MLLNTPQKGMVITMKKKIFSIAMAVMMVLSLSSFTAAAYENAEQPIIEDEGGEQINNILCAFGSHSWVETNRFVLTYNYVDYCYYNVYVINYRCSREKCSTYKSEESPMWRLHTYVSQGGGVAICSFCHKK
jgi:hypothetical protein